MRSSPNTKYVEKSSFGLLHRLLHQSGITSERALVQYEELDEFPCPYDNDSDQSFETRSDKCTLTESDVGKTHKVTESKQAMLNMIKRTLKNT